MDDPFDFLDCVLRSRYLAPVDLPSVPFWNRLPAELRSELANALVVDSSLRAIVPLVWQVRERLHGKRVATSTGMPELMLGLLHLRNREGRIEVDELLTRACHIANSYASLRDPADRHDCCAAGRPFIQLRRELREGNLIGSIEGRIGGLFAPYTEIAMKCVQYWGLAIQ